MAIKAPLIDGEVLREFFDKADPYLTQEFLGSLSHDLAHRSAVVSRNFPKFPVLWDRAPATRRLAPPDRAQWQPRLEDWLSLVQEARVTEILAQLESVESHPPWLVDWVTFWSSLANPDRLWWARWVYSAKSETGALVLLVENPAALKHTGFVPTYEALSSAERYLRVLLDNTKPLPGLASDWAPIVTLAVVYSVYMFTMASWKLTEEFTQVLPPFPVVVRTLLGVNRRWEGT